MAPPLSEQITPVPDDEPAKGPWEISPEQAAQGQHEIDDWDALFNRMEAAKPPTLARIAEHLRPLAVIVSVLLGLALFILLLQGRSGAPWFLAGGGVTVILSIWIYSCSDARSRVTGPLCTVLAVGGLLGLITGLVIEPEPPEPANFQGPTLMEREMQKDFESMAARIENRNHVQVTERWRPAEMSEMERAEQGPPPRTASRWRE